MTSLQSHRYAYWKVALGAFKDHPLIGLGSGGFQVRWFERRKIQESVVPAIHGQLLGVVTVRLLVNPPATGNALVAGLIA